MIRGKIHIISACILLISILTACQHSGYKINNSQGSFIKTDSLVGSGRLIEAIISPYRDSLKLEMGKVIGKAEYELSGGFPEGLLSNFVTDLVPVECERNGFQKPDICIVNVKGLRIPISKGDITVENIYQLMPFENEIVYLTMSKDQVLELFDFMASVGGDGMSGASFGINGARAVDIRVQNKRLENRNYIIATSDYLADGGDHFEVFQTAIERKSTGLKVRDAIIKHIKELTASGDMISSKLDKRIYYAQ
ncbi:5'-nucleotidase C-terminal domain-containing protein [Carboxylicivirga marina]|uniref:5'-nucleotidase C-terminal domain-containing protein n=1 Tax=Carboxylicivirga marina TaxID=2800988 RepID=A0ABS1HK55_9BACT|nr:5'-nucleotidase [Carboxylicivirga marina]MBK3517981.1 5'-nucleotidase C-terminal domain-containing protein [Carboxylicivirga marina]